ncbi:ABC transporter permease [Ramlibacter sp. H39-3-26]|uniref:ABC transporter permease n=1 Tax=Curvibacter soli TaxID=3031331 RepID=UPI0023DC6F0B|nr:ABC transporter permease [Ramlibacter sp. H39-3-26]MDF1486398.1 ABC transporter permease [Ramlibacter sp. H39-3-26]
MLLSDVRALWRARSLVAVLTRREVQARYAGSAAGMAWAYAQPLLSIAAYYLVFDVVFSMRVGGAHAGGSSRLGVYLIVGSLPWMAFCDAIARGTSSLVDAGAVLQKNALPPVLFPARTVLATAWVYGPLMLLLALAYLPLHGLRAGYAALAPLLLGQLLLSFLLAYLLAIFAAALRDVIQVVGFWLSVGIFMSPVLFPLTLFPQAWRWVLWLNPMTPLVLGYQAILLEGGWPPAAVWHGLLAWLLALGWLLRLVVRRCRDQLTDWL